MWKLSSTEFYLLITMTTNGTVFTYLVCTVLKKRLIKPSTLEIVECKNWCGEKSTCQCRRHRFDPSVRKIPWRRKWQPASVFLPEKLMDRGAWRTTVHGVTEEWDRTEYWLTDTNESDPGSYVIPKITNAGPQVKKHPAISSSTVSIGTGCLAGKEQCSKN